EKRSPRSRAEILKRITSAPLEFAPGERFDYSNSNYFLLGMVIEKTSGMSYQQALSRQILEPAGMTQSGVLNADSIVPHSARGYRRTASDGIADADIFDPAWAFGAGGIYATTTDLKRWDDALTNSRLIPN